jgi:hypothetical protein
VLTAISLVPLPSALRESIDPVGSAFRDDGATLLDLAPWPGLTRDTPASLRALIFFLILLGIAVAALRLAPSERGRYKILAAVATLSGLAAVVTGVHELVGAKRLYGFYEMHASPSILGPLLNENHLGALMAMGTCVAAGLVMYPRQPSWLRTAWMSIVLLCGAMTAASHSRGAILALIAGSLVAGGLLLGQRFTSSENSRRRRARFATSSLPIGIVGVCVVVLVVYSSAGSVSAELSRTNLEEVSKPRSKFAAWKSSELLIRESPWVGVGRGGFEPSFTRVHPASGSVTFGFVENEYIQAVIDWGIPGSLCLALSMLWFAGLAVRRWRDGPLTAGALGALTAIAVQSNVDFGVELLGLAVPVTMIAATVSYVPLREETGRALAVVRGLRVVHAIALLGGALLLLSSTTNSIQDDHERLSSRPTAMRDVRAALERHPLDYYGYWLASELMTSSKDSRSIHLLNHAMRLHPTHPGLHRVAAGLLFRSGHPDQAAIEYATALRSTLAPERLIGEVTSMFPPNLAATAIPVDLPNPELILNALHEQKHDDVAALWLGHILEMRPKDVHACNLLYELSLSRGDLKAAEIAGRNCVELLPDHQTRVSLAGVLLKRQGYSEVIRLLQDVDVWTGLIDEKVNAWLMLCDAHLALGHWDEASSCLHHLDATGELPAANHGEITKRLEQIHENREQHDHNSGSNKK